jgi:hypothetical protein
LSEREGKVPKVELERWKTRFKTGIDERKIRRNRDGKGTRAGQVI